MFKSLGNIFNLFFPELCSVCEKSLSGEERIICVPCRLDLPLTNYSNWKGNNVETSFHGRIPIENATSLLYFNKKGNVQKLIHQLKYKNKQEIGTFLGNWLGEEMERSKRFTEIDYIIPVPLHSSKMKKRGYNQVSTFGNSLSDKLNIPFLENVLKRISKSKTQTLKNRFERSKDVDQKFELTDLQILKNKHILLIDDIITTGATLEACSIQLLQSSKIKISIATMAYTL
jgi:ComF family protein